MIEPNSKGNISTKIIITLKDTDYNQLIQLTGKYIIEFTKVMEGLTLFPRVWSQVFIVCYLSERLGLRVFFETRLSSLN